MTSIEKYIYYPEEKFKSTYLFGTRLATDYSQGKLKTSCLLCLCNSRVILKR